MHGMQGEKRGQEVPGKSRDLQKKFRDLWTSLVPGPWDHRTFKVSKSCPVPSRDLPGTSRDGTVLLPSLMYTISPRSLLWPADYRDLKIMWLNYQESSDHWNVDQKQVCYNFPTRFINFHGNKSLFRYWVHAIVKSHLVKAKIWICNEI